MSQKENIFHFNHIDKSKAKEEIQEIKELYKYYHFKYWTYQKAYKYFKKLNLAINMSFTGLIVIGAVAGGLKANPAILGSISGAGLALQTFSETKDYKQRIEMSQFAFSSCLHTRQPGTVFKKLDTRQSEILTNFLQMARLIPLRT